MCDHCDQVVNQIAEHEHVSPERAREMLHHAFNCEDDECPTTRTVTRYAMDQLADELPPEFTQVIQQLGQAMQAIGKATQTLSNQIQLEQRDGTPMAPERLIELLQGTQDAAQAEIDLLINQPRREGE